MKKIGRYAIKGLLGKGGMGKIFRVAYPVTGKIAALKLLAPPPLLLRIMGQTALEEAFTKEAVAMAAIRHPHVADILDFDRDGRRLFYVMDFYCNSLGRLMGESGEQEPARPLSVEKVFHYTRQTLEGLACLHFRGIIHRDIKPANLLITDQDTVKICDFGLSKQRGETRVRHDGIRVGSPFYAAPEQEKNPDNVDAAADLYAVGVMLHKMLTGLLPGQTGSALSRLNPDLNTDWDGFIKKALAPRPEDRFPFAHAMLEKLEILALDWEKQKEKICGLPEEFEAKVTQPKPVRLRSRGEKIPLASARDAFGLDPRMQPLRYAANQFRIISSHIIEDHAFGLVWQQSGALFTMTWQEARAHVERLNRENYGGYNRWRLPTVPELLTLVSPLPKGSDLCLEPIFDMRQKWLWSSDRSTFTAAWYVSLEMGFADRNDFSSFYHVKAVCSARTGYSAFADEAAFSPSLKCSM